MLTTSLHFARLKSCVIVLFGENLKMEEFNPAEDDYFSQRNSYLVNVEDAGVALTGQKSQDESICKYILMGKPCRRGVYCKFAHPKPHEIGKHKQKIFHRVDKLLNFNMHPDQIYSVDVTQVINCIRFYAHITDAKLEVIDGNKNILRNDEMLSSRLHFFEHIQKCYRGAVDFFGDNHDRVDGEIVVARSVLSNEWRRGKITGTTTDKECEVFFVDFGNVELLSDLNIRDIKPELLQFPYQATECCLVNVELNPAADMEEATNYLTEKLDGNIYGKIVDNNGAELCLDLFNVTNPLHKLKINDEMVKKAYVLNTKKTCNNNTDNFLGVQPG